MCTLIGAAFLLSSNEWQTFSLEVAIWPFITGFFFITMFFLMGTLTRTQGVGSSSVVSRMSLIIPTVFFFFFHDEYLKWNQLLGIVFGLIAVRLSVSGASISGGWKYKWLLPIAVFIGYGLVDVLLRFVEQNTASYHLSSSIVFFTAFLLGTVWMLIRRIKLSKNAIVLGIVLGLVNYFSIFFFLKGLRFSGLPSTVIFPLNGILILLVSNLGAVLLFKEKLTAKRIASISFAVLAISLLYLRIDAIF